MMIIRPLEAGDSDALMQLAGKAGVGFTSLPADEQLIASKVSASQAAFTEPANLQQEQSYLFVLEDDTTGRVAGICGIESAVGYSSPWYNYRIGTLVHSSRELQVHNAFPTLYLSNDHTGCAEVCTLFLDPDYRHSKNGSLLSKSRFLFMAEFPDRFNHKVIAEMRGMSDAQGKSPFWEGLGRHFFSIDFAEADRLTGLGKKQFIAELMPRHPLYINMLPEDARAAIGQVHDKTRPARKMLEDEGFRNQGYVDIFDAGPILETHVQDIRAVRESRYAKARIKDQTNTGRPVTCLISNTNLANFRCVLADLNLSHPSQIDISSDIAKALQVSNGEAIRAVPLFAAPH
jgi:arginine N-succinyltransferase